MYIQLMIENNYSSAQLVGYSCFLFVKSYAIFSMTSIVYLSGPVVMDISGFTEKGFKRKLAVQALFGKILYLAEVRLHIYYA